MGKMEGFFIFNDRGSAYISGSKWEIWRDSLFSTIEEVYISLDFNGKNGGIPYFQRKRKCIYLWILMGKMEGFFIFNDTGSAYISEF